MQSNFSAIFNRQLSNENNAKYYVITWLINYVRAYLLINKSYLPFRRPRTFLQLQHLFYYYIAKISFLEKAENVSYQNTIHTGWKGKGLQENKTRKCSWHITFYWHISVNTKQTKQLVKLQVPTERTFFLCLFICVCVCVYVRMSLQNVSSFQCFFSRQFTANKLKKYFFNFRFKLLSKLCLIVNKRAGFCWRFVNRNKNT